MLRPIINHTDLEQAIADYDYITKQIKALEEKREALKDSLVKSYFADQPIYRDVNGCVLATYSEKSREFVKGASLKIDLPEIYVRYMYTTKWFELRIK